MITVIGTFNSTQHPLVHCWVFCPAPPPPPSTLPSFLPFKVIIFQNLSSTKTYFKTYWIHCCWNLYIIITVQQQQLMSIFWLFLACLYVTVWHWRNVMRETRMTCLILKMGRCMHHSMFLIHQINKLSCKTWISWCRTMWCPDCEQHEVITHRLALSY